MHFVDQVHRCSTVLHCQERINEIGISKAHVLRKHLGARQHCISPQSTPSATKLATIVLTIEAVQSDDGEDSKIGKNPRLTWSGFGAVQLRDSVRSLYIMSGRGGLTPHEKNVGDRCPLITQWKLRTVRDLGCIEDQPLEHFS